MPAVSVIMSVYNGEAYLREAIDSILNQTFTDFEFLIIDDTSTDGSAEITKSYNDDRIKLVINTENIGLTRSLNKGIDLAKGRYIARMDADDISVDNRIKLQFEYMEANKDIMVLGGYYKFISNGKISTELPLKYNEVKLFALTQCPIAHPTAFIKKTVFYEYAFRYDTSFAFAQDYDLWTRILELGKIENLPEVLLHYRTHQGQVSSTQNAKQTEYSNKIRLRQLEKLISFDGKLYTTDFAVRALVKYGWDEITSDNMVKVSLLLQDIWKANKVEKIYNDALLLEFLKSTKAYYMNRLKEYKLGNLMPILDNPDKTQSRNWVFAFGFIVRSIWGLKTRLKRAVRD